MSAIQQTDDLFFNRQDLDRRRVESVVSDALKGTDDGELFFEYRQSESLTFDDGRLKNASFDTTQGFGLRAVAGEVIAYPLHDILAALGLEFAQTEYAYPRRRRELLALALHTPQICKS